MAVNLIKGQKISLDKEAGSALSRVTMGLGWDIAAPVGLGKFFGGGGSIDLDASCIVFDDAGKFVDAVWFRQLKSNDGSIHHTGDNLTGAGDGDDEQIIVDMARVPASVKTLFFTVNSFTGQTFETVSNAFCRIVDQTTGRELARYNLSAQGSHTALVMAKVYRHSGEWKMHAVGEAGSGRTFQELMPLVQSML